MGKRDVVQGTLEMLILKTLALEPKHGYGMATRMSSEPGRVSRESWITVACTGSDGTCQSRQERVERQ
jgi:hypothetical protein